MTLRYKYREYGRLECKRRLAQERVAVEEKSIDEENRVVHTRVLSVSPQNPPDGEADGGDAHQSGWHLAAVMEESLAAALADLDTRPTS